MYEKWLGLFLWVILIFNPPIGTIHIVSINMMYLTMYFVFREREIIQTEHRIAYAAMKERWREELGMEEVSNFKLSGKSINSFFYARMIPSIFQTLSTNMMTNMSSCLFKLKLQPCELPSMRTLRVPPS